MLAQFHDPAGPEGDGADRLSDLNFQRISALIGAQVGIKLPPSKRLMVEGRLRRRLRALGHDRFDSYCSFIFKHDGLAAELPHLIDAVTTNKTDFFREPAHFDYLAQHMLPALLAQRTGERRPTIKVWSAASSTGAEPYTIAMVLGDLERRRGDFRFAVLGTDISTAVIAQGRRAVYSTEAIAPVPPDMKTHYLMYGRGASHGREVRIVPELRRQVRFARLNLMDTSYPVDKDVDVIFLRNVLIYFEKPVQEAVIGRLIGHLRPGGYLALGHSESMIGVFTSMRQVAPAVFRKD